MYKLTRHKPARNSQIDICRYAQHISELDGAFNVLIFFRENSTSKMDTHYFSVETLRLQQH